MTSMSRIRIGPEAESRRGNRVPAASRLTLPEADQPLRQAPLNQEPISAGRHVETGQQTLQNGDSVDGQDNGLVGKIYDSLGLGKWHSGQHWDLPRRCR